MNAATYATQTKEFDNGITFDLGVTGCVFASYDQGRGAMRAMIYTEGHFTGEMSDRLFATSETLRAVADAWIKDREIVLGATE